MNAGPRSPRLPRLLCITLASGLGGCDDRSPEESHRDRLNVILISIDTARADHFGCYGHPVVKTPHIDRLAAEGTIFMDCTAAAPITLPSHASILTGTYPFVHKARDNGTFQLHDDNLTLTEVLRDAGVTTLAQVGAFVLNRRFGLGQGFTTYRDVTVAGAGAALRVRDTEITAEQVTNGAIELLRGVRDERFFLFVHYFDPHEPHQAPRRLAAQYINPYVAEIAYTDEQIGRLLEALREVGADQNTLVVLTADHGEGLGQHGEPTHAYFLYDATLAVPLIFWCPNRIPAGRRVSAQVRTIDIAPTILAILGTGALPEAQGVDLSPLIAGEATDLELAAYAETFYPRYNFGYSQLRALREAGWKYVHAPRPELYRVSDDPRELKNLAASQPQRVAEMRARLHGLIERAPRVIQGRAAQREVTSRDRRALESLGYMGGVLATRPAEPDDELALLDPEGPNPMEHVREIRLATHALGLVRTGQHRKIEQAIRELLAEVGEQAEGFVWAHAQLAGALAAQGKLEEALEHFHLAVQARPDDGQMHVMMGIVLQALGRTDEALQAFEGALALEPVFATAHLHVGLALAAKGRRDEAAAQYRLAIEKDPLMYRAHLGLARLLAESGQLAQAIDALDRALAVARANDDARAVERLQALRDRYQKRGARGKSP